MPENSNAQRTSTLPFFMLTYVVSWTLWAPLLWWLWTNGRLNGNRSGLEGLPVWIAVLWFVGSWAPSLIGISLTARSGGRQAVKRLLGRALDWRVGTPWHAITWLGPMGVGLAGLALYVAFGGNGPTLSPERWALIPVALLLALPFGPIGEEFGWRGYALPRLLTSHSALTSSLIIGLAWTFWHLPLFWAPLGTSISGSPVTLPAVGVYMLEIVALSILITWLFSETGGSLLIVIGAHAAWNAGMHRFFFTPVEEGVQAALSLWITLLLVLAALAVVGAWSLAGSRRSGAGSPS